MRKLRRIACAIAFGATGVCAAPFSCTPTSNSILFGTYNPLTTTPLDATGTFVIVCTDAGGNPNRTTALAWRATLSSPALRQMAPPVGTDRVNHNLYTDAVRATVWGDGNAGTAAITGTVNVPGRATATTPPINYFGRITAAQDVSAASPAPPPTTYTQNLTITVTCTTGGTAVAC